MMGEILEILVIMLIVATAAFAPFGYFVYRYAQNGNKPFSHTEPHGDHPSLVNDLAEAVIHFIASKLGKK